MHVQFAISFLQNMLYKPQAYDTWDRHRYVHSNIAASRRYRAVYACILLSQTNFALIGRSNFCMS